MQVQAEYTLDILRNGYFLERKQAVLGELAGQVRRLDGLKDMLRSNFNWFNMKLLRQSVVSYTWNMQLAGRAGRLVSLENSDETSLFISNRLL